MTPDEFDRLFECFVSGSLSDEDTGLLQVCLQDPHWQRRWRELSDLDGMLAGEFGIQSNALTELKKSERAPRKLTDRRGRLSKWRAQQSPWLRVGLAVAGFVICALAGLNYFRSAKPSPTSAAIAILEGVSGEVALLRGNGRETARNGLHILERDGVQTEKGSRATVRFTDGTAITLFGETESRVSMRAPRVTEGAQGKQLTLDIGSLEAIVMRQPAALPMIISTPHSEIKILGTKFTLVTTPSLARLEVREGRVQMQRLVDGKKVEIGSGHFAVASRDADLVALPIVSVPPAVSRSLFNGKDMSGWNIARGTWKVENGVVIGSGLQGKFARIESTNSLINGELTCKLRMTGARVAEVQFGGYRDFFSLHWENLGVWKELKVRAKGTEIRGTLDGHALQLDQGGAGDVNAVGVLSFYATANATLEIKDAQWTDAEK